MPNPKSPNSRVLPLFAACALTLALGGCTFAPPAPEPTAEASVDDTPVPTETPKPPQFHGQSVIQDRDGYKSRVSFSVLIDDYYDTDISEEPPGFTRVTQRVFASVTVNNRTAGRTYDAPSSFGIVGAYPLGSVVCEALQYPFPDTGVGGQAIPGVPNDLFCFVGFATTFDRMVGVTTVSLEPNVSSTELVLSDSTLTFTKVPEDRVEEFETALVAPSYFLVMMIGPTPAFSTTLCGSFNAGAVVASEPAISGCT